MTAEPVVLDEEPTDPAYVALGETLARPRTFDGPRWTEPTEIDVRCDPWRYVMVCEDGAAWPVRLEDWLCRAVGSSWAGTGRRFRVRVEVQEVPR